MSKHSIVRWIKIIGVYLLVAAVAALGWLWCALPEDLSGTGTDAHAAALWLGGAAARARQPQCGQHPGSGQLPDHAGTGRLAAGQDHPRHRDAAPHGQGVRHALWGENVLGGGACGGLFRGTHRRRRLPWSPRKAGGAAAGRPGDPHGEHRYRDQRAGPCRAGGRCRCGGGGGLRPQGGAAADHPLPVWDAERPVAGRNVGAGFLRRGGHSDLCGCAGRGIRRAGSPISDSDTGERVALRSGEIVACQIVGCTGGTAGSPRS